MWLLKIGIKWLSVLYGFFLISNWKFDIMFYRYIFLMMSFLVIEKMILMILIIMVFRRIICGILILLR